MGVCAPVHFLWTWAHTLARNDNDKNLKTPPRHGLIRDFALLFPVDTDPLRALMETIVQNPSRF